LDKDTRLHGTGDRHAKIFLSPVQGDSLLRRDHIGSEFPFPQAARARAIAMARKLSKTPTQAGTPRYISVQDEAGAEIFQVPLMTR
jgi:hypothetical protein